MAMNENVGVRIALYDVMRGVAITLMLVANGAAYFYVGLPPLFLRFLYSFAAPIFMMLAGMMLALSSKQRSIRGLLILAIGCVVDIFVWRIVPFVTFDVLYTIGFAVLVTTWPARRFPTAGLVFFGCFFILAGRWLRLVFGYEFLIFEIPLSLENPLLSGVNVFRRVVHQFFIDGWFPLFPWLGFVWLGAAMQRSLQISTNFFNHSHISRKLILSIIGFALFLSAECWSPDFSVHEARMGYSELFYPPDVGFCFTYISAFAFLLLLLDSVFYWAPIRIVFAPFGWMGRYSLSIYVFHLMVIKILNSQGLSTTSLMMFLVGVMLLWILLATGARLIPTYFPCRR